MKPKQCFADANIWLDEAENGLEIPTVDLLRRKYEMERLVGVTVGHRINLPKEDSFFSFS
jgi:hypothetical protein